MENGGRDGGTKLSASEMEDVGHEREMAATQADEEEAGGRQGESTNHFIILSQQETTSLREGQAVPRDLQTQFCGTQNFKKLGVDCVKKT